VCIDRAGRSSHATPAEISALPLYNYVIILCILLLWRDRSPREMEEKSPDAAEIDGDEVNIRFLPCGNRFIDFFVDCSLKVSRIEHSHRSVAAQTHAAI